MNNPIKPIIQDLPPLTQEREDAFDVPEDKVFTLDANGNPVELEVPDDAPHHQA